VSALKDDLQQVRSEQARLAAGAIGRDDLKPLAQNIAEVDKKRPSRTRTRFWTRSRKRKARIVKLLASAADSAPKPPVKLTVAPAAENGFQVHHEGGRHLGRRCGCLTTPSFKRKGMKSITLHRPKTPIQAFRIGIVSEEAKSSSFPVRRNSRNALMQISRAGESSVLGLAHLGRRPGCISIFGFSFLICTQEGKTRFRLRLRVRLRGEPKNMKCARAHEFRPRLFTMPP